MPERLTASAPEIRLAFFQSPSQRLLVHVCDGQDLSRARILHNGRNEAISTELCLLEDVFHRTTTPRSRRYDFAWPIVNSRKWKMDAASTALAEPSVRPLKRCSRFPAPPEAITGMRTASA